MNPADAQGWWVVCLCAAWCGVCRDWRAAFDAAAAAHPQARFAWVDIEDEADALGDVDVETFPTVLVMRGREPWFLGPVPPSGERLSHLVERLMAGPPSPGIPAHAQDLAARLSAGVLKI